MKSTILLILVSTVLIFGNACTKEDSASKGENTIKFYAESDVELNNIVFIARNNAILWEESINTMKLDVTKKFKLLKGDKIWIRSIPADGDWHMVKTAIYIDGVKLEAKEKFCIAGTGCTHVYEN